MRIATAHVAKQTTRSRILHGLLTAAATRPRRGGWPTWPAKKMRKQRATRVSWLRRPWRKLFWERIRSAPCRITERRQEILPPPLPHQQQQQQQPRRCATRSNTHLCDRSCHVTQPHWQKWIKHATLRVRSPMQMPTTLKFGRFVAGLATGHLFMSINRCGPGAVIRVSARFDRSAGCGAAMPFPVEMRITYCRILSRTDLRFDAVWKKVWRRRGEGWIIVERR